MFKLKRFALLALPTVVAAFAFNGPAQATTLAAQCLDAATAPGPPLPPPPRLIEACQRLHLYHYVIPQMQRELSRYLRTQIALVPIPICAPLGCPEPWAIDRDYLIENARLLDFMSRLAGNPEPEPSYPVPLITTKPVSVADQLKGATALRAALQLSLDRLDQQIAAIRNGQ